MNLIGDRNQVIFTKYEKVSLPAPESVDMRQTLEQLAKELGELSLKQRSHARIAETATDFVDVCNTAGTYVADAAAWPGKDWHKLLPLVGLAAM